MIHTAIKMDLGVQSASSKMLAESFEAAAPFTARLHAIGTAVPALCMSQREMRDALASHWNLHGAALDRWHRIIAGSGIEFRYGVRPPNDVVHLSTAARMRLYEEHAGALAAMAARRALDSCGIDPALITDLIVVSCTGFSAPGVDVDLVMKLGLRREVRRTNVGFMGCFGAISGLRTAVGACAANPTAIVLVVCVELCSLHARIDSDAQNQVASALFGDGAAAALVVGQCADIGDSPHNFNKTGLRCGTPIGRITSGASQLLDEGREWMTWRVTDAGFAMTLARQIPDTLRNALDGFVRTAAHGMRPPTFIVHPGGPGILDAVEDALQFNGGSGLEASRKVLARIGNVSSGTVLFVLEQALRDGCELPAMLLAFGPGLTIESLLILPDV